MRMMSFPLVVTFGLCSAPLSLAAQEVPTHAPDGGTHERIESLVILPATNAPFSATVVTEWTKLLPDGSKETNWNHRIVARDSSGRVFQERRHFSPDGEQKTTRLSELDYADPNRHELYVCRPDTRVCNVFRYDMPTAVILPKQGTRPDGKGSVTREDLGRKTIETLDVVGSREVTTVNANVIGNQKPEPTVKEFWFSPYLGINIITKRFDPHASAIQNFEVRNIKLSEPDPRMFEPPSEYRLVKVDDR